MKIHRVTANLDKVGSRYWALYMKNPVIFIFAGERNAPWKHFKKQYFNVLYSYMYFINTHRTYFHFPLQQ